MDNFFISIYKVYGIVTLYCLIPLVLYFFAGNDKNIKVLNKKVNYSKQLYILHIFKFILGLTAYVGLYKQDIPSPKIFDLFFCLIVTALWVYINKLNVKSRYLFLNDEQRTGKPW